MITPPRVNERHRANSCLDITAEIGDCKKEKRRAGQRHRLTWRRVFHPTSCMVGVASCSGLRCRLLCRLASSSVRLIVSAIMRSRCRLASTVHRINTPEPVEFSEIFSLTHLQTGASERSTRSPYIGSTAIFFSFSWPSTSWPTEVQLFRPYWRPNGCTESDRRGGKFGGW